jgi:hypothetical protein
MFRKYCYQIMPNIRDEMFDQLVEDHCIELLGNINIDILKQGLYECDINQKLVEAFREGDAIEFLKAYEQIMRDYLREECEQYADDMLDLQGL